MSQNVRFGRIVTHWRPHFDELVAIKLLWQFGNDKFPGIEDAVVEYCRTGDSPEGKTWQEHLSEGTVLVGIGGSPYDEHPAIDGSEGKGGESACSLVAKDLKVHKHPAWKRLVELATEADRECVHELHIANRIKTCYRTHPDDHRRAMRLGFEIIDDFISEQFMFLEAQKHLRSLEGTDNHLTFHGPDGDLDLVVVESDNYKVSPAARSLKIALVIQRQPSGHVQIFCDSGRYNINLCHVAAELRKAECIVSGMSKSQVKKIDPDILERPGKITEAPSWYYFVGEGSQSLYNGTETTPDTGPTRIPLREIIKAVRDFAHAELVNS